jgi:hypothetical protein
MNSASIAAGGSIGLLALPGFITCSMVIVLIIRSRATFANNSFYTLLVSLAICEMIQLGPYCLLYLMPCILLQERIFGDTIDMIYGPIGCEMCYFAGLYITELIALNRYCAVCHFDWYERVFSKNLTLAYVAVAVLLGICSGAVLFMPGFAFRTYVELYTSGFDFTKNNTPYFIHYSNFADGGTFIVLLFCYVAILLKRPMKMVGNANLSQIERKRREKTERKLALQFGIIALIYVAYHTSFQIFLHSGLLVNPFFSLIVTLLYIVYISINSYIYLVFNSDIRSHFVRMFCNCHSTNTVVSAVRITAQNTNRNVNEG